jgi:hypothetical protein
MISYVIACPGSRLVGREGVDERHNEGVMKREYQHDVGRNEVLGRLTLSKMPLEELSVFGKSSRALGMVVLLPSVMVACEESEAALCEVAGAHAAWVGVTASQIENADRWEAVKIWQAGGAMTMPTSARVSPVGTVAIPDFATGDVWLLGRDGIWLEPVAGRGQGPGELLHPIAAGWNVEGDLLVLDAGQNKVERYDLDSGISETLSIPSNLLGPIFNSGSVGWFGLRGDGMAFVELPGSTGAARIVTFARASPDDDAITVAWESEHPEGQVPRYDQLSLPEWPRALLAVGGDRWAVAPRSDTYEIIVYGPSDEDELHLCVSDRDSYRRSEEVADERRPPEFREQVAALPRSETKALFSRLQIDQDGRIWIERELPQVGSMFDSLYGVAGAHLDVISAEGNFLARTKLPDDFRFQDARGDTIWGFSIGEFGEVEVVAAELKSKER